MKNKIIGIIGGQGLMGNYFTNLFRSDDFKVLISDINTELTNIEVAKSSDIVIVCVPINKSVEVIKEINKVMSKDKLFMDITSVKKEPVLAMLESNASVIGMHPMFGPFISTVEQQVIVLTPERDSNCWLLKIKEYFIGKKVNLKITTSEEHDKIMSLIQVLIHFNTICIGVTMSKLGIDIEDTLQYTSPIYRMELFMIGSILGQSPRLYGSIPMFNPHTLDILLKHKTTVDLISKLILTKNIDEFTRIFSDAASFFGDYTKVALKEINYLTDKLVEYDNTVKA